MTAHDPLQTLRASAKLSKMNRTAIIMSALLLTPVGPTFAQGATVISADQGRRVTNEAQGNFDVQIKPEATFGDGIGRFSLDKTFHGDLEGTSTGEMLAVRAKVPGSAGYVVIEHVTGKLKGKSGGFMLQHYGVMDRNKPDLKVLIIPDSGTGDLTGITGQMTIDAAANHAYVLTYSLPAGE